MEETGLNPGLNRPGRNRFLPPEVEETGKNWKEVWNVWLSKYFPLQEAVNLKTSETAKNVLNINTAVYMFLPYGKWNQKLWWLPERNRFLPLEVEETGIKIKNVWIWMNRQYFPLQEVEEATAKRCCISILYSCIAVNMFITACRKMSWLPGKNKRKKLEIFFLKFENGWIGKISVKIGRI